MGLASAMLRSARSTAIFLSITVETRAEDVRALIHLVQKTVSEKFGVELELEVELVGEW